MKWLPLIALCSNLESQSRTGSHYGSEDVGKELACEFVNKVLHSSINQDEELLDLVW